MASFSALARRSLQSPSTSPSTMNQNYSMNGKIIISALAILLFFVFVIILLHMYAKWLRRSGSINGRPHQALFCQDTPLTGGLDREVVEALPVFTYKASRKVTKASESAECVVCLSTFRQDDNCKFLPRCNHLFHTDCINMWFISNTTCPVCRTAADPNSECGEVHGVATASVSCCFTEQDEREEHHQRPIMCISGSRDDIACNSSEDSPSRSHSFSRQSPASSWNYRRSKSEKFSQSIQGTPLAPNTTTCMNRTHWQSGGRSLSHGNIDILNIDESLVDRSSCPALPGSPKLCSNLLNLVRRPAVNSLD